MTMTRIYNDDQRTATACAYGIAPCNWCKQRENSDYLRIREETTNTNVLIGALNHFIQPQHFVCICGDGHIADGQECDPHAIYNDD